MTKDAWYDPRRLSVSLQILLLAIFWLSCDNPGVPPLSSGAARLRVTVAVSADITDLVIEVTAPDIGTPLQFNLEIHDRVASGTITLAAGSERTLRFRAYNEESIETHRGETTVDIVAGTNPTVSVVLAPLLGDQPLIAYVGSILLTITPRRDTVWVDGTLQLHAAVIDADSNVIGERVHWGSMDVSKATIDTMGVLTAHDTGYVEIVAVASGVAGTAGVHIRELFEMTEHLVTNSFAVWYGGVYSGSPSMALSAAADEFTLSWGNFALRQLSSEPRVAWPNDPAFEYSDFTEHPWEEMYHALTDINEAWRVLDELSAADDPDGMVARAKVFAKYVQGLCHGWLALMFDQAFVIDETVDLYSDELELVPYQEVWAAAKTQLEEALAMADTTSFVLPTNWINGNSVDQTQLAQLIHSQLARWIPQVARTPAERSAVDWSTVVSHVDLGIQSDFSILGDGGDLWSNDMLYFGFQTGNTTWSRADYKTIGWAESEAGSGNCGATDGIDCYSEWLAAPVETRDEFVLNSPDLRVHPADDGLGAGLDFLYGGASAFPASRGTYHFSHYLGSRYEDYVNSGETGPAIYMTVVEMQLTKAEGLLRTAGPSEAVVEIINTTRVNRGGLSPALATESMAVLLDKIIYEKRIEGYGTCSGCAFFDRRGWGPLAPSGPDHHQGLVEGTPLHFPVPARVLAQLGLPIYTFGGVGNELTALGPSYSMVRIPARQLFAPSVVGPKPQKRSGVH